ncbi:substrate-binding periplasmic protein [Clostridioides difficile]
MNLKKLLLLIIVIASIFISCIFPFNINALGSDNRTIRVAYPIQKGLTELDEQGKYSGYTYEYLLEIAQYTGWNYEFVQVSGGDINEILTKLMKMLEKGEIDIMGGLLYNEQMEKLYNYAGNSYGVVNTVLQVLHENTAIDSINSKTMKEIRVAVIENSDTRIKELNEYCKMNSISPRLVNCKTTEEQLQALKDGKVDALLYMKNILHQKIAR